MKSRAQRAWCGLQSGERVAGAHPDRWQCPVEGNVGLEGREGRQ